LFANRHARVRDRSGQGMHRFIERCGGSLEAPVTFTHGESQVLACERSGNRKSVLHDDDVREVHIAAHPGDHGLVPQ
jgi:hypothetical protein